MRWTQLRRELQLALRRELRRELQLALRRELRLCAKAGADVCSQTVPTRLWLCWIGLRPTWTVPLIIFFIRTMLQFCASEAVSQEMSRWATLIGTAHTPLRID